MTQVQTILKKIGFDVMVSSSEFSLPEQVLSFRPDLVIGCGKGTKVSTIGVGRRMKDMTRWMGRVILIFPSGVRPDPLDLMRVRMDMALEAPVDLTRMVQVLGNFTEQDPNALLERMVKAVAEEAETNLWNAAVAAEAKTSDRVFVTGGQEAAKNWNVDGGVPQGTTTQNVAKGMPEDVEEPQRPEHRRRPSQMPSPTNTVPIPKPDKLKPMDSIEPLSDPEALLPRKPSSTPEKLERSGKYKEFLKTHPVEIKQQSLKRTEARRVQKRLRKDWSEEKLKSQDELRQDFTAALFKKKN